MLIDAAKGVETQTRKLFDVCRKRGTPIVTFVNKLDRPARDSFALMSEVEEVLGIHTTPRTWPIGSGDLFKGVYDLENKAVLLFENTSRGSFRAPVTVSGLYDPSLAELIGEEPATDAARRGRAARGCWRGVRAAEVPAGPADARVLRQRAHQLRHRAVPRRIRRPVPARRVRSWPVT